MEDTAAAAQAGQAVKAYRIEGEELIDTGITATTNESGDAALSLPEGSYRIQVEINGLPFLSDVLDPVDVPTDTTCTITTPLFHPVTVTVADRFGETQASVPVFLYDAEFYTQVNLFTDPLGKAVFQLPEGHAYRFRADQYDLAFWSGASNHCETPICTAVTITALGFGYTATDQSIEYTYDPLNRLTAAEYDTGLYYQYAYDEVGNRMMQETAFVVDPLNPPTPTVSNYSYDDANRLTAVDGQAYTFDANGNLLNDGLYNYSYDGANRLTGITNSSQNMIYTYNGNGDRIQQTINGTSTSFALDLNTGYTQVLSDGTSTYLYGLDRLGQGSVENNSAYLYDALGSVRQVFTISGANEGLSLTKSYDPYGSLIYSNGSDSMYGFSGEQQDASTGLVYLRARTYNPASGTFTSRDTWDGDANLPISYNRWLYGYGNPVKYTDPSGMISCKKTDDPKCIDAMRKLLAQAQILKNQVTSGEPQLQPVEALAQLTAFSYEIFDHDRRGMMWGMTKVLVGFDPNDYHYLSLAPVNRLVWDKLKFDNTKATLHEGEFYIDKDWLEYLNKDGKLLRGDWKEEFFDGTPNQAYHFWYFAASKFFDGSVFGEILGNLANVVHDPYFLEDNCGEDLENWKQSQNDILREWARHTYQTSKEDFSLAQKGMQYGNYIGGQNFLPIYPDKWIRNNLKE